MSVTLLLFAYARWLLLCNIVLHKRTNSQFKQIQDCTNNAIVAELNVVDAQKNVGIRNSNVLRNREKSSSHLHNSLHQMDSPVIRLPTCETEVSTTTATAVPSASASRIEMVPFTSITFFWLHSIDSVLLTVMGWPSRSLPCMLSMTASIVHSLLKLTKPNPRECWISVPLIGSPAFPARFKKRLLTNQCCAPISGCLFQEDKVKSFNIAQPLCFLFLALLLLKAMPPGLWGNFLEPRSVNLLFLCLVLPLLIQWHRILATTLDYICFRACKSIKVCSCKCLCYLCLHMFFWGPRGCCTPPILQKWQMYAMLLLTDTHLLAWFALLWSSDPKEAIHPWAQYRFNTEWDKFVIDFLFCFTYVPNAAALGHNTRHDPVLLFAVSSMLWSILYGSFLSVPMMVEYVR